MLNIHTYNYYCETFVTLYANFLKTEKNSLQLFVIKRYLMLLIPFYQKHHNQHLNPQLAQNVNYNLYIELFFFIHINHYKSHLNFLSKSNTTDFYLDINRLLSSALYHFNYTTVFIFLHKLR